MAEAPQGTHWHTSGRPSKAHPHGEDADWWRAYGPGMVQAWLDWRAGQQWDIWVTPDGTPAIELELEVFIDGEKFKLIIDQVFATDGNNGRLIVVDTKSGGQEPAGTFQLGAYKVAIETRWPQVRVAGGTYWMARKGGITGVQTLSQYTPEYVAMLARRVKAMRSNGVYLPRVSSLCRSCKVGRFCAINNGEDSHMDPDHHLMRGGA